MSQSAFERIGGEDGVRRLVTRFYELMDELPEAYAARKLHPQDLSSSAEKLVMYLTGWLGGPQTYTEKFGHPRLRQRHFPFPIGNEGRDAWLLCMRMALDETVADVALRDRLFEAFVPLANHMVNQG